MSIDAIGYLRRDVSGVRQSWDETQVRSLARRLGYNLQKIITFTCSVDDPEGRLRNIASRLGVDAVVVPSVAHFYLNTVPAELVKTVDVITVEPHCTYARWAGGRLPVEIGDDPVTVEPDVMVSIQLTSSNLGAIRFVACESAARNFTDQWKRYGRCGAAEFAGPDGSCGRLPCKRLWVVPPCARAFE